MVILFYLVAKTFQLLCSQKWIYVFVFSTTITVYFSKHLDTIANESFDFRYSKTNFCLS